MVQQEFFLYESCADMQLKHCYSTGDVSSVCDRSMTACTSQFVPLLSTLAQSFCASPSLFQQLDIKVQFVPFGPEFGLCVLLRTAAYYLCVTDVSKLKGASVLTVECSSSGFQ